MANTTNPENPWEIQSTESPDTERPTQDETPITENDINSVKASADTMKEETESFGNNYAEKLKQENEASTELPELESKMDQLDDKARKAEKELINSIAPEVSTEEMEQENGSTVLPTWALEQLKPETIEQIEENPDLWPEIEAEITALKKNPQEINNELTPPEKEALEKGYARTRDKVIEKNIPAEAFKAFEQEELNREKMKLILRLVVKVSAKIAEAVARNIAKTTNSQELRFVMGTMADLIHEGEIGFEKLVTGEEKPNLAKNLNKAFLQPEGVETIAPDTVVEPIEV